MKLYVKGRLDPDLLARFTLTADPAAADLVVLCAPREEILGLAGSVADAGRRTVVVSDFDAREMGLLRAGGLEALNSGEVDSFLRALLAKAAPPGSEISLPKGDARPGLIVTSGSTKGGVGKSTIAVNAAVHCAGLGKTVLVDYDAAHGDVVSLSRLDRPAPVTVANWRSRDDPAGLLATCPAVGNLWALPFANKETDQVGGAGEALGEEILAELGRRFDFVLVDLGVFSSLWTINAALKMSDRVILVSDQADECWTKLPPFLELGAGQEHRHKMRLLVNMVGFRPVHTPGEVQRHLGFATRFEVPLDLNMWKVTAKGRFPVLARGSPAGKAMVAAFGELLGRRRRPVRWYEKMLFGRRREA